MKSQKLKHVFGPVPSRRLGLSLGVDLVPYKTCSFDCIYCQLGRTTNKTIESKEYIPIEDIILDVENKLKENCQIDYITLSGSGEPTLHSKIGKIIDSIKTLTKKPVAILTNGSLLWKEEIRESLMKADLVIPSLDAGDEDTFRIVNRPCNELSLKLVVSGMKKFIRTFRGKVYLEVFLLKNITSLKADVIKIAETVNLLSPTRTQLNTIARPPCEKYAIPVSKNEMEKLSKFFPEPVDIIADFKKPENSKYSNPNENEIINILSRRPCIDKEISESLDFNLNETLKILEHLCGKNVIQTEIINGSIFYKIKDKNR